MFHIEPFQLLGRKKKNAAWIKKLRESFEHGCGIRGLQQLIKDMPELDLLKEINPLYYKGKSGYPVNANQLYALIYPNLKNECSHPECRTLVGFKNNANGWALYCSTGCLNSDPNLVDRRKQTCIEKYGADNPSRIEKFKKKRTDTLLNNLGVDNAFKSKKVKRKIKKTIQAKYGVDNVSQSELIKEKKRDTYRLNFNGYDHWTKDPEQRDLVMSLAFDETKLEKCRKTMIRKYGVDNAFKSPEIQEMIKAIHQAKYGFDFACQSPEIKDKIMKNRAKGYNLIKKKPVKDKFGKTHTVIGFEHFAIQFFSSINSIIRIESTSTKIPKIDYTDKRLGTRHRYYPDLVAYSKRKANIVEVKSDFTLNINLKKNMDKFKAACKYCESRGDDFWLFVFDGTNERPKIVKNPKTLKQLRDAGIAIYHHALSVI
jgi:hypothetical protein